MLAAVYAADGEDKGAASFRALGPEFTISCFADRIGIAMQEFGEAEGQWLSLATILLSGAVFVVPVFDSFRWSFLLYAVLSLTVFRMIPVAMSLVGIGLHRPT